LSKRVQEWRAKKKEAERAKNTLPDCVIIHRKLWIYNIKLKIMKIVLNNLDKMILFKYTLFVISLLVRSEDSIPMIQDQDGKTYIGSTMHLKYLTESRGSSQMGLKFKTFKQLLTEKILSQYALDGDFIHFLRGECGSGIIREALCYSTPQMKTKFLGTIVLTVVSHVELLIRTVQTHRLMKIVLEYWETIQAFNTSIKFSMNNQVTSTRFTQY
jgi:hypothetical protein